MRGRQTRPCREVRYRWRRIDTPEDDQGRFEAAEPRSPPLLPVWRGPRYTAMVNVAGSRTAHPEGSRVLKFYPWPPIQHVAKRVTTMYCALRSTSSPRC